MQLDPAGITVGGDGAGLLEEAGGKAWGKCLVQAARVAALVIGASAGLLAVIGQVRQQPAVLMLLLQSTTRTAAAALIAASFAAFAALATSAAAAAALATLAAFCRCREHRRGRHRPWLARE